jgi:hypothetical protein
MSWLRVRFTSNADDYRPISFPPPGPYWCSGYTVNNDFECDEYILIAYVKKESDITKFWPEAKNLNCTEEKQITFSDRFPKPDWWKDAE